MAVQEYLVIKKQANRRDTWMAQIIQAQAESKNMKQLRLWKQLQQTEAAQQKVTAVCKALGTNQHHAGLQQVTAPKADGDPTRIMHVVKEDLEVACLNEAHQQFTQVATTPMLQEPLSCYWVIQHSNQQCFNKCLMECSNGPRPATNIQKNIDNACWRN